MTNEPHESVVAALIDRGAQDIAHPGGNLLDHLVRTSGLLVRWGAPTDLVLAGVAHAAYGTDGFGTSLFELDERELVAGLIGPAAEAIVYRYASCDRAKTYPSVNGAARLRFGDRFTGTVETLGPDETNRFAELTFANELDLIGYNEAFAQRHGPAIRSLFRSWRPLVSAAAWAEYDRLFGT